MSTATLLGNAVTAAQAREAAAQAATEAQLQQERAVKRAAAELARQQAAVKVFEANVRDFKEGFANALLKHIAGMKSVALAAVDAYATALVSHEDVEVPQTDPGLVKMVNDKFAYGLKLAGSKIPEGHFFGQRQDWFPELLNEKLGLNKTPRLVIKPGEKPHAPKPVYTTSTAVGAEPKPAITPATKKNHRKQPTKA